MKARLTALLSILLFSFCGNLFAVGLGDIEVQSGLNEPLKARIKLIKTGDLKENELLVSVANDVEFTKRGMTRDAFYLTMRFTVDLKDPKNPVVIVTSDTAVKEPSLDFLLELAWPTGKLVRSYTVLMEKP